MNNLDLFILPIHLADGQEEPGLPGLLATTAPRRAERSRREDYLLIYMSLTGSMIPSPTVQESIVSQLVAPYYNTRGTVTTALRAVAEQLNRFLVDQNARSTREDKRIIGLLNLAVLRHNILYLAHAGPTHSFLLKANECLDIYEPLSPSRGLGIGRQFELSYYQYTINAGDVYIPCVQPPPTWTEENLANAQQMTLESLRRRLIDQSGSYLQAVITKFQRGEGKLVRLKPRLRYQPQPGGEQSVEQQTPDTSYPNAVETGPAPMPEAQPPLPEKSEPVVQPEPQRPPTPQPRAREFNYGKYGLPTLEDLISSPAPIQPVTPKPTPPSQPEPVRETVETAQEDMNDLEDNSGFHEPFHTDLKEEPDFEPEVEPPADLQEETPQMAESDVSAYTVPDDFDEPDIRPFETEANRAKPGGGDFFKKYTAKISRTFNDFKRTGSNKIHKLLSSGKLNLPFKNRYPGKMTGSLSPTTMIFITIAVPLVVVGIATAVYFNSGVSEQHDLYLYQAQQFAMQALSNQADKDSARDSWTQAMYWLDQAEEYGRSEASRELRIQIIDALDDMEGVARLPLQSSLNHDLPSSVAISKMIATESDVYLLDQNSGEVLRIYATDTGYKLDQQFECGPGPSGSIIISPLIDVVELPLNNRFNAEVLGIDSNGNLSYCMPGDTPLTQPLSTPDIGWAKISAMALDNGNLYVLDINNNAVWVYEGYNLTFSNSPRLFFDLDIPILGDVVDMEVNGDDLFLLHNDGRMSRCAFRVYDFADTKCEDPTVYGDQRGETKKELETFPDSLFTQMITTEPPDPSVYILDPYSTGIYHFSLMLNLQRILLPMPDKDYPIPTQTVTAFTINPNRTVLMAFGNKIYQAPLP